MSQAVLDSEARGQMMVVSASLLGPDPSSHHRPRQRQIGRNWKREAHRSAQLATLLLEAVRSPVRLLERSVGSLPRALGPMKAAAQVGARSDEGEGAALNCQYGTVRVRVSGVSAEVPRHQLQRTAELAAVLISQD